MQRLVPEAPASIYWLDEFFKPTAVPDTSSVILVPASVSVIEPLLPVLSNVNCLFVLALVIFHVSPSCVKSHTNLMPPEPVV